jgi:hypothetical protein
MWILSFQLKDGGKSMNRNAALAHSLITSAHPENKDYISTILKSSHPKNPNSDNE